MVVYADPGDADAVCIKKHLSVWYLLADAMHINEACVSVCSFAEAVYIDEKAYYVSVIYADAIYIYI